MSKPVELEANTMIGTEPYREIKYREVNGKPMAYIDEGEGDAIVFQHGQPASSYVWRNIMPHLEGLGRLVACDLIGMGRSEKLSPSGPDRYRYAEHRDYLFALWDALDLGDRVVLVLHDWGAALGFDWAKQHPDRVQGIAHMEAIAAPLSWSDLPEQAHAFFQALRSPEGERLVLEDNLFIEARLPGAVMRQLTDEEMDHYRQPFANAGEDRRPTLSWPRNLPLDGEPADVVEVVSEYAVGWPKAMCPSCSSTLSRARSCAAGSVSSSAAGLTRPKSPSRACIRCRRTVPMRSGLRSLTSSEG
jgi:haloalkane dehalogenase